MPNMVLAAGGWGSTYTHTLTYDRYPVGTFPLWSPNIGTVTFPPSPHGAVNADALPPEIVFGPPIHIYGEPTPEQQEQMMGIVSYHLTFVEYNGSPVVNAGAKTITFYLRRTSDFESRYVRIPIYHIVPDPN
jgi:hypothetical protein